MRQASFAPAGASPFVLTYPRLAPWAAFLRRFAACVSSRLRGSLGCDSRHNRCCRFRGSLCGACAEFRNFAAWQKPCPSHESAAGLICSDEPTSPFRAPATISDSREQPPLLPGWFRASRKSTRRNFWLFETSRRQTCGSSGWFGVRGCGAICAHLDFACLAQPPLVTFGRALRDSDRSGLCQCSEGWFPAGPGSVCGLVAWLKPCPPEINESSADLRVSPRLRLRLLELRDGGWSGWEAGRHRESCITVRDS
jgi:hypothetical protein